jgi:hypothetical protein
MNYRISDETLEKRFLWKSYRYPLS